MITLKCPECGRLFRHQPDTQRVVVHKCRGTYRKSFHGQRFEIVEDREVKPEDK